MTLVSFRVLVHSEQSNLPLTCSLIIGTTTFSFLTVTIILCLQHFDCSRSLVGGTFGLVLADSTMKYFHFNASKNTL